MEDIEQQLQAYLDSLDDPDPEEESDYAILFPEVASSGVNRDDKKQTDKYVIASTIASWYPNIEEEIQRYFVNDVGSDDGSSLPVDRASEDAVTHTKDTGSGAGDVSNEDEIAKLTTKWSKILGGPSVDVAQIDELLQLKDSFFEAVFRACSDTMTTADLEKILLHASKRTSTIRKRHMRVIADVGLLPQLTKSDGTSRPVVRVTPVFEKLAKIDPFIAMENVLLPMVKKRLLVPNILLTKVDKREFLRIVLRWMEESSAELTPELVSNLSKLIDGRSKLDETHVALLVKLFGQVMALRPSDKDLTFLLRTFVDATSSGLKREQLAALADANRYTQIADLKASIDALIARAIDSLAA